MQRTSNNNSTKKIVSATLKSVGYRKYKARLREEFHYRCVYCDTNEPEIGGSQSFCVDHYQPQKKFPHLIEYYDNLFYACRHCNGYKADYWPNYFESFSGRVILNPRLHHINEDHIDKSNVVWVPRSKQGEWNIDRLKLNSDRFIKLRTERKAINDVIEILKETYYRIQENIMQAVEYSIEKKVEEELEKEKNKILSQIDALKSKIEGRRD